MQLLNKFRPTKHLQDDLVSVLYYFFCALFGIVVCCSISYIMVFYYKIAIPTLAAILFVLITVKPKENIKGD